LFLFELKENFLHKNISDSRRVQKKNEDNLEQSSEEKINQPHLEIF